MEKKGEMEKGKRRRGERSRERERRKCELMNLKSREGILIILNSKTSKKDWGFKADL